MITLPRIAEALEGALTRAMNGLAPDLPKLVWQLQGPNLVGMPECDGVEAAAIVARWAQRLDLGAHAAAGPGAVEYAGKVDNVPVIIWAVTDRELWESGEVAS